MIASEQKNTKPVAVFHSTPTINFSITHFFVNILQYDIFVVFLSQILAKWSSSVSIIRSNIAFHCGW